MDTNLTLELFIGRGMIDKSLAKDIKEEMIASADSLLEWRGTNGTRQNHRQTGMRSGAGAPPDGSSAQEKAAAALRQLRAGI